MAWTTPRDYVTNEILTAAILNVDHRDNLNVLSTHAHSGAAGNGNSSLTSLVKETFTDASAPAAPGSGLTALYTVSGRPHFRAGSGGSDTTLAILADVHAQTHASAHQPGGADTMAVDAVVGTGSLRTLGTGSTQGAAGNHTHTCSYVGVSRTEYSADGDTQEGTFTGDTWSFQKRITKTPGATNRLMIITGSMTAYSGPGCEGLEIRLLVDGTSQGTRTLVVDNNDTRAFGSNASHSNPAVSAHTYDAEFRGTGGNGECWGSSAQVMEVST